MRKLYLHEFTVKAGSLHNRRFPIDMLRYDYCCPGTQDDAAEISFGFSLTHSDMQHVTLEDLKPIKLKAVAPKDWKPTKDRWSSFGWVLTHHRVMNEVDY